MTTIYRVFTIDHRGVSRVHFYDNQAHAQACWVSPEYWLAEITPVGRDWWNDPAHPRLQRVIDSLETISTQEYKK